MKFKTKLGYVGVAIIVLGLIIGLCKVLTINKEYAKLVKSSSTITQTHADTSASLNDDSSNNNTYSTTTTKQTTTKAATSNVTSKVTTTTTTKAITTTKETLPLELESCNIPYGDTSFHSYMDYKCITNSNSQQYKLQQMCWTDSQGIRRQGNDVCIALGSYYGTNIGDRYLITTDTGNSYTAVLADCKADIHTDANNQYREAGYGSKNIVEFIVDSNCLSGDVLFSGNIGTYNNYSGNIISIQKISEGGK